MKWEEEISKIEKDNIHGATYLLEKAANILISLCDDEKNLKKAAERVKYSQPQMALIYNLADGVLNNLKDSKNFIEKFMEEEKKDRADVIKKASELIEQDSIILTHSFSSMVFEALKKAKKEKNFKVICTESRPKNEGVELAKRLDELGIDTTLIIDAAAPYLVKEVDLILFGADGIGDFGLVHKIGTFAITLAAKEYDKKVYSLATKRRFWPKNFKLPKENLKNSKEITSFFKPQKIINLYFDITPAKYIEFIY